MDLECNRGGKMEVYDQFWRIGFEKKEGNEVLRKKDREINGK